MTAVPRKILIVDDEDNVRHALSRVLRREGYEVLLAQEPSEGLELLARQPVDLILSDHEMPKMTGPEFLRLVRDRHPDCVRIMLTGKGDLRTAIHAINEGEIYRFLTKPWDDAELKVTLFLALEQLDLQRENRRLLAMVRSQRSLLDALEREHPGIRSICRDASGAILLEDEETSSIPAVA